MTEPTSDRRSILAVGGLTVLAGLAGCTVFRDTKGVPGDGEPPEQRRPGHPPSDPLGTGNDDTNDDPDESEADDEEEDGENGEGNGEDEDSS